MKKNLLIKLTSFVIISVGFIFIVIYYSNALPKSHGYKYDSEDHNYCNSKAEYNSFNHEDIIEKTFPVNLNGMLYIKSDVASIKIETWDKNEVNVIVEKKGDEDRMNQYKVSFSNTPDRIEIYCDRETEIWNWGDFSVTIKIKIPKNFNNDINNSAGDIRVYDCNGNIKIRTSAGNIVLKEIKGEVDIESSAGNIDMKSIAGMVKASTSAGNIELSLAEENNGVDIETSAGNIHVHVLDNTKANLHCSASLGNVSLSVKNGFSGEIDHNDVDGTLNGGGKSIKLHTSIGNVSISSNR
jgi:hypothetical protein